MDEFVWGAHLSLPAFSIIVWSRKRQQETRNSSILTKTIQTQHQVCTTHYSMCSASWLQALCSETEYACRHVRGRVFPQEGGGGYEFVLNKGEVIVCTLIPEDVSLSLCACS